MRNIVALKKKASKEEEVIKGEERKNKNMEILLLPFSFDMFFPSSFIVVHFSSQMSLKISVFVSVG